MKIVVLKPDAIGDFLIASGAIRLLADAAGEENLVLSVRTEVEPLARREFPRAAFIPLPLQRRRRGRNITAVNIFNCFPAWLRLCVLRADTMVCLRSMRNFLATAFFLSPRVRRRVAPENVLLRSKRVRRQAVEKWMRRIFRPDLVPYPAPRAGMPSDLESHRLVVAEVLGRRVSDAEIMPRLARASWQGGDHWLLCPFSSNKQKDYSPENWIAALREVASLVPAGGIRLAGGGNQREGLESFAAAMREAGPDVPVAVDEAVDLSHFPETVAKAALVLTVDTATAHLACAMRAPAVIVACGINPDVYSPYSPDGRQHWLVGAWERVGRSRWQETVPPADVASAIRRAVAA